MCQHTGLYISGSPEQSYAVLSHLHMLVTRAPILFSSDYKHFYCRYSDPSYVKKLKLEMITAVAKESNTYDIVTELSEYAANVDVAIARESVRAVGKIALQQYDVNVIVDRLLQFLETEKDYVTAETLFLMKDWNALYVENMLRVESSAVGEIIGSRLLMAVVDRLIEIDVEIKWEHILHEDSSKLYIFDMEMEDDEENEEPGKPGSEADVELPKPSSMQSLGGVADKMDVLMEMTLEHLKLCADEGRLPQIYDTLMHSFQSTIVNTHKSKFTHFLSSIYALWLQRHAVQTSLQCCVIFLSINLVHGIQGIVNLRTILAFSDILGLINSFIM